MKNIDKTIKKYKPMMHHLLIRFKIKKDYEDILQLLKIKTWEVLRDKKYKTIYKDKQGKIVEAKLSTWLYKVLSSRLQDILKTNYGVKIKDDGKSINELPIEKQTFYYLKHPILCGIPFFQIENYDAVNALKCKLDFELYCSKLSKDDKELINLIIKYTGDKRKVALIKNCTIRSIDRKLLKLKSSYKTYLINKEEV